MAATRSEPVGRRAATEAAIVRAASVRLGALGSDGVSLREVARAAGCTHTLVGRYFGSKAGLVDYVLDRFTESVADTVDAAWSSAEPFVELLDAGRANRSCVQLLVRCGLGDLRPNGFAECLRTDRLLSNVSEAQASEGGSPDRRSRLVAYSTSSLLLGWLTFDELFVASTGLRRVSRRRLDRAVAAAAHTVMGLAGSAEPVFEVRDMGLRGSPHDEPAPPPGSSRDRLLASAVTLFAERGPASVTLRDIGSHAGLNQGLIHRHFGSKDHLLAKAIEEANSTVLDGAFAPGGFDYDAVGQALHHNSSVSRLLARAILDDIDIVTVRRQFPVIRALLDAYADPPKATVPRAGLADPRVAVLSAGSLAYGSVIWGDLLRGVFGLRDSDGTESAVSDVAQHLLAIPRS